MSQLMEKQNKAQLFCFNKRIGTFRTCTMVHLYATAIDKQKQVECFCIHKPASRSHTHTHTRSCLQMFMKITKTCIDKRMERRGFVLKVRTFVCLQIDIDPHANATKRTCLTGRAYLCVNLHKTKTENGTETKRTSYQYKRLSARSRAPIWSVYAEIQLTYDIVRKCAPVRAHVLNKHDSI